MMQSVNTLNQNENNITYLRRRMSQKKKLTTFSYFSYSVSKFNI